MEICSYIESMFYQISAMRTDIHDKSGNILTKSEYAYTTGTPGEPLSTVNYSYGNSDWKDYT